MCYWVGPGILSLVLSSLTREQVCAKSSLNMTWRKSTLPPWSRKLDMNEMPNPRKCVSRPASHQLHHQIAGLEDQLSTWWPKWSAIWNQQWADDVYGFWLRYFSWYLVQSWMLCNYGCSCGYFAQEQVAHISYAMMSGGRVLWSIQSMSRAGIYLRHLEGRVWSQVPLQLNMHWQSGLHCNCQNACVFREAETHSDSGLPFARVLLKQDSRAASYWHEIWSRGYRNQGPSGAHFCDAP